MAGVFYRSPQEGPRARRPTVWMTVWGDGSQMLRRSSSNGRDAVRQHQRRPDGLKMVVFNGGGTVTAEVISLAIRVYPIDVTVRGA